MTEQRPAASAEPTPEAPEASPGAGSPGAGSAAHRRFRRDRKHGRFGGVCAGLGLHYGIDPIVFRIVLVVLSATGGIGLIFYGLAWLVVPYADDEENEVRRLLSGRVDGPALTAVLCAMVGCGLFLSMLNNGDVLSFAGVLALLLAGAAQWSLHRGAAERDTETDGAGSATGPPSAAYVGAPPPEAQAPPVPDGPSWWRDPIVKDGTHEGGTGYFWGPGGTRSERASYPLWDAAEKGRRGSSPAARERRRGPRGIGGWVFLLALVAGAAGTSATWEDQPLGTSLQAGLACALAVFGLGIALSAFLGRTGIGSIVLAVITAGLLAGASVLPSDISTQWERTTWRPANLAAVQPAYQLGSGSGTLDLSAITIPKGTTVPVSAQVGAGRMKVIVPENVTVRLSASVGLGDIRLPDENDQDVDIRAGEDTALVLPPAPAPPDVPSAPQQDGGDQDNDRQDQDRKIKPGGTVELRLQAGTGQVEVARAAS